MNRTNNLYNREKRDHLEEQDSTVVLDEQYVTMSEISSALDKL